MKFTELLSLAKSKGYTVWLSRGRYEVYKDPEVKDYIFRGGIKQVEKYIIAL